MILGFSWVPTSAPVMCLVFWDLSHLEGQTTSAYPILLPHCVILPFTSWTLIPFLPFTFLTFTWDKNAAPAPSSFSFFYSQTLKNFLKSKTFSNGTIVSKLVRETWKWLVHGMTAHGIPHTWGPVITLTEHSPCSVYLVKYFIWVIRKSLSYLILIQSCDLFPLYGRRHWSIDSESDVWNEWWARTWIQASSVPCILHNCFFIVVE